MLMGTFVLKTLLFLTKVMYDSISEGTYMNDYDDNRLGVLFEMLAEGLKQEQNEKSYDVMLPKVFKKYFDIHNDEINYDYYYNLMTSIIDEIRSQEKMGKFILEITLNVY